MPQKKLNTGGIIRPLEPWCDGSEEPVLSETENNHVQCNRCPRIVSIVDGAVRRHRKIELEKRYEFD